MSTTGWQQQQPQKRKGNPVVTRYPPPPPGWKPPYQQHLQAQAQVQQVQYSSQYPPYHGQPAPYQPHQPSYPQPQGSYTQTQHPYTHTQAPYQAQQQYSQTNYGPQYQQATTQPQYPPTPQSYQSGSQQASPATPHWPAGNYPPQQPQNSGQWAQQTGAYPQQSWQGHQGQPVYSSGSPNYPQQQHNGYSAPSPYPNGAPIAPTHTHYGQGHQYNQQTGYVPPPPQSAASHGYAAKSGHHSAAQSHEHNSWNSTGQGDFDMSQHLVIPEVDEGPPPRKPPNSEPLVYGPEDDHHFWDFENSMGALWPKSTDPVNQRTSIGVHVWRPAVQATRALAVPYSAAEIQDEAPPPPPLGNADSVSEYFTLHNNYECSLDIRDTDHWQEAKDYAEFREIGPIEETIPLRLVREQCSRNDDWTCRNNDDDANVMDALDKLLDSTQRLSSKATDLSHTQSDAEPVPMSNGSRSIAAALARDGFGGESKTRESIKPPSEAVGRDQSQEDVLARLGVTGIPKPRQVSSQLTSNSEYGNQSHHRGAPPPPPPPERMTRSPDPWTADRIDVRKRSISVVSNASHHTLAGSDFEMDAVRSQADMSGSNNEKASNMSNVDQQSPVSRKRSFIRSNDDRSPDDNQDGGRQPDDGGRRKRPKPSNGRSSSYARW